MLPVLPGLHPVLRLLCGIPGKDHGQCWELLTMHQRSTCCLYCLYCLACTALPVLHPAQTPWPRPWPVLGPAPATRCSQSRQVQGLKPQASGPKPQASSIKPQASGLKPQASHVSPQSAPPLPAPFVSSTPLPCLSAHCLRHPCLAHSSPAQSCLACQPTGPRLPAPDSSTTRQPAAA